MLQALVPRACALPATWGLAAQQCRHYGNKGSLHLTMEPLDNDYEGVFQISLTRPDARNAIGACVHSMTSCQKRRSRDRPLIRRPRLSRRNSFNLQRACSLTRSMARRQTAAERAGRSCNNGAARASDKMSAYQECCTQRLLCWSRPEGSSSAAL